MDNITIFIVAVGLSMDAFAVALGAGTSGQGSNAQAKFRLSFHFGLFQALMTALGWFTGNTVAQFISSVDHWIALALLAFVGINMIRSGLDKEKKSFQKDPSRGGYLVILSVATSLDALAVGLSMAMLHQPILTPVIVIGLTTLSLSLAGVLLGNRLSEKFGKRMEIVGGVILILIGLRILYTHLW